MLINLRDPWKDGRPCATLDSLCAYRDCLQIGEDKGTFTPGFGYTHYHAKPKLVCIRRDYHGCPHPLPEVSPEKARCCPAPDFAKQRKGFRPLSQRCRLCGTSFSTTGPVLEIVKKLPILPHSTCKHSGLEIRNTIDGKAWRCQNCDRRWDIEPQPYAVGETLEVFQARKHEEWRKKNNLA